MHFFYELLLTLIIMTGWAWLPPIIGKSIYFIYTRKEHQNDV